MRILHGHTALDFIISPDPPYPSGSAQIDFKGGRVDATQANTAGVPQPQDTLDSHIASFARQGFTQEEMIALVACGHTFGGVQHVSFPDVVPASSDPSNTPGNVPFDTTGAQFDTKVCVVDKGTSVRC